MTTRSTPVRRRTQLVLAGLGGLVFLLGVLVVASPRTAVRSRRALEGLFGNDYFVVAVAGGLGLLVVLIVLGARAKSGLTQTAPPAPEAVYPVAQFGADIDAFVSDAGLRGVRGTDRHEAVRDRLREIALTAVVRAEHCTQAEAREQLDDGSWTDNDVAAAFLAEGELPGLSTRLWAVLRGTSPYREAARVTAIELARLDREATK